MTTGLPWPLDGAADVAGRFLSAGGHLGQVMLAAAVVYPLLGMAGRRARAARAAHEVDYMRPTLASAALANGATRYEVEYDKARPVVAVTLAFPDATLSARCRDDTYETAILSALGLVLAARRAARDAAQAAPEGARRPASPLPPRPPPRGASHGARPRGAVDDGTPWHEVLGVGEGAGRAEVKAAFRRLAHRFHPDHGGTAEMMRHLVRARAEGLARR